MEQKCIFDETKRLLEQYYILDAGELSPMKRPKSEWQDDNKFGFLLGIAEHGVDSDKDQLNAALIQGLFAENEERIIDSFFDRYIFPFHRFYHEEIMGRCRSPQSMESSRGFSSDEECESSEHKQMKKALVERDKVCLFCWMSTKCEGAHIIQQEDDEESFSFLHQAGLHDKHQVQNGLLLCMTCHDKFSLLIVHLEVCPDDNEDLVIKSACETRAMIEGKPFFREVEFLRRLRHLQVEQWETVGFEVGRREMALYFSSEDAAKFPSRKALEFHRRACLIWEKAQGKQEEYLSYYDDEDFECPINTAALKRRFKIKD
jgi:hypothetical protein